LNKPPILNVQGLGYVVTGIGALLILKRYYGRLSVPVIQTQTAELQIEHL
jgi:hypothetical protein